MKILKLLTFFVILLVIVGGFVFWQRNKVVNNSQSTDKKLYKASTEKVIVLRTQDKKEITAIDLSAKEGDFLIKFYPHDLIGVDNKKQIWVTASASQGEIQAISKKLVEKTKRDEHVMMTTDQIIVIDVVTDKIVKRIPIGVSLGLADIIIAPDNRNAYVTTERANAIYKVNIDTHKVNLIQLPPESNPHQLAFSSLGTELYARNEANGSVFLISTKTNEFKNQVDNEKTKNLKWSNHQI